jgi:Fe-S oxidoreductase
VDPGCAQALRHHYPRAGVAVEAPVELLVERAARELASMTPVEGGPVRWHDPCQLGRGLGVYEAPRAILHRVLGHAPGELDDHRAASVCSGGGGLLPATMPATASAMARGRIDAHERAGGGRVVTACASSLRSLRREGAKRGVQVDDLVTWIARGLLKRPSTRSGSLPRP